MLIGRLERESHGNLLTLSLKMLVSVEVLDKTYYLLVHRRITS